MTLLAIQLGSLDPEPCLPLLKRALEQNTNLRVLIFFTSSILSKLDSAAKRSGQVKALQDFLSALYICSATKFEVSCDIIFANWCGYPVEEEIWEYSVLYTSGIVFFAWVDG
jgi:hypothetical protein